MRLDLCTWQEVEAYLEASAGIVVPIGSIEQHGPTGLIGTDAICAEVVARGVGEAADALVGPTLSVGMAQHHMAFAGTITYRPSTLVRMVEEYVAALARHGFRRFFFVNGHGGNIATLGAAFSEIYANQARLLGDNAPDLRCRLANWYMAPPVKALARDLFGDKEGSHATPSEISLAAYAYPEAVKTAPLPPVAKAAGGFTGAADFRRRYPDGRMGSDPSGASPAHGKRLYETAVKALAADYRSLVAAD